MLNLCVLLKCNSLPAMLAVLLDILVGEPQRLHPLVGFGNIATKLEGWLFQFNLQTLSPLLQRTVGAAAVLVLVAPICLVTAEVVRALPATAVIFIYLSIGLRSLSEHAFRVRDAVQAENLQLARSQVALIVSRDTSALDRDGVLRATVESVLENGSDAVLSALFWFFLFGPTGAVMFRLINTLDAMWGYKSSRYLHFGWAAARLDDLVGFVPARLTALCYALSGHFRTAMRCWLEQAPLWYSPNAGPVMASGAGALQVELGGTATYGGASKVRPLLGQGAPPAVRHIDEAANMVYKSVFLMLGIALIGELITDALARR